MINPTSATTPTTSSDALAQRIQTGLQRLSTKDPQLYNSVLNYINGQKAGNAGGQFGYQVQDGSGKKFSHHGSHFHGAPVDSSEAGTPTTSSNSDSGPTLTSTPPTAGIPTTSANPAGSIAHTDPILLGGPVDSSTAGTPTTSSNPAGTIAHTDPILLGAPTLTTTPPPAGTLTTSSNPAGTIAHTDPILLGGPVDASAAGTPTTSSSPAGTIAHTDPILLGGPTLTTSSSQTNSPDTSPQVSSGLVTASGGYITSNGTYISTSSPSASPRLQGGKKGEKGEPTTSSRLSLDARLKANAISGLQIFDRNGSISTSALQAITQALATQSGQGSTPTTTASTPTPTTSSNRGVNLQA